MEENKRVIATQKRVQEYLDKYPNANKEHTMALIESVYPNIYGDDSKEAIAHYIIIDFVREQTEYSDSIFLKVLKEQVAEGKYTYYTKEQCQLTEGQFKTEKLVDYIYKTAPTRTLYLSECKEFIDEDVIAFLKSEMERKKKSLAKVFFSMLNIIAQKELHDFSQEHFYKLSFHCYGEPNGDIVFTKHRRSIECWDEDGNPIYSEKDIEQNKHIKQNSVISASSGELSKKTKIILFCAIIIPLIIFLLVLIIIR